MNAIIECRLCLAFLWIFIDSSAIFVYRSFMKKILMVSNSENSISLFMESLHRYPSKEILRLGNCEKARRILLEREFDLCIIDAPLPDEFGEELAYEIASKTTSQVLLLVQGERYAEIDAKMEQAGVYTLEKPVNRQTVYNVIKLVTATYYKLSSLQSQNKVLQQKIEDFKIIDRAKCVLIQYLNMTEPEAHKYIERQAMDFRLNKRTVAERILKTYEM